MTTNANTSLIVIDMQNDFLPGGSLAVPDGDAVIKPINNLINNYENIIFTQDWHPVDHCSFQGWPPHCIKGSYGAEICNALDTSKSQLIVRKGFRQNIDSYSAFYEENKTPTGLVGYLKEREITEVILCGLALDFCVGYSALDAVKSGFNTSVILSSCRGIDINGSLNYMLQKMQKNGVNLILGI